MGIPFKRKHFFCSQFVADVLKENIMFKGNHESFLKRFNINKEIG